MSDEKSQPFVKELAAALGAMTYIQEFVYSVAQQQGLHPFIKFSGLMKQYLELCKTKFAEGGDFVMERLPLKEEGVEYIAEKIAMLYPAITSDEMLDVFWRSVVGTRVSIDGKRGLSVSFSPSDARDWAKLCDGGKHPLLAAVEVLKLKQ